MTWTAWWILLPVLFLIIRGVRLQAYKEETGETISPGTARTLLQKITLALFLPFLLLLGVETVLDMSGFARDFPPIVFETNEEEVALDPGRVLADPIVLFKFKPGSTYNAERINSLGYRDREVDPIKAPNTLRVICFGDSITAQGRPGYSKILHQHLQEEPPNAQNWEAFNMAVYGYTSQQGLAVFREWGKDLSPDYITAYFGPNDRNLHDRPDHLRMGTRMSPRRAWVMQKFRDKRIGQFVLDLARQQAMKKMQQEAGTPRVPRVPPEEYRKVMRAFVTEAREIGATPILMTAARRDLSPGLIPEHADNLAAVTQRHDDYNDIVREVARELEAPLIDIAELMSGPEFDHVFARDGVHFDSYSSEHHKKPKKQPGLEFIARSIHTKISQLAAKK